MKADLNEVIYSYESNLKDIYQIIYDDIALEATDTGRTTTTVTTQTTSTNSTNGVTQTTSKNTTVSQNMNNTSAKNTTSTKEVKPDTNEKPNNFYKIAEKIKQLLEKIKAVLQQLSIRLNNRARTLMTTDKGFFKTYYSRKSMVKPQQAVRVESYAYNDQVLEVPIIKLMKEIITSIDKLCMIEGTSNNSERISAIVTSPQGSLLQTLFAPYSENNANINTTDKFLVYLTKKFRGDKKVLTYTQNQLPIIEKMSLSSTALSKKCQLLLRNVQASYNKMKGIEYRVRRDANNKKVNEMAVQNLAKASILYNTYSTLMHGYFELKLEQILNYRQILKRFYQF